MNKVLAVAAVLSTFIASGCSTTSGSEPISTIERSVSAPQAAATKGTLTAQGRVVPVRSAALSVSSSGVVADVLVAEGDQVQAGQVLLRLDRTRAEAEVAQAEADVAQARAAAAQLQDSATPEEIAAAEAALRAAQAEFRQTSGGVTAADRAAAQARLAQARARLAELQAGPKRPDLQAADAQRAQAQANLTTQRDQLSAAKTDAQLQLERTADALTQAQASYSTALQNWQYVQDTGRDPVTPSQTNPQTGKKSNNKLTDAQRQQYYDAFVQAEGGLRSAETAVEQARVAAETARQAEISGVQAAEQQVAGAQASLDKLNDSASSADIAQARAEVANSEAELGKLNGEQRAGALDAAQAAVEQAQANLDKLRAGVSKNDLSAADAGVQRAEAALKLAQVALAEAELRAPFAGTIGALETRAGEYVAPSTPVVQLADVSAWQIETTDLTERDIVPVRVGSRTSVTFDAISDLELGGTVSRIRALGENKQGNITYAVTITLDQQDPRLRWNMTALVSIEA